MPCWLSTALILGAVPTRGMAGFCTKELTVRLKHCSLDIAKSWAGGCYLLRVKSCSAASSFPNQNDDPLSPKAFLFKLFKLNQFYPKLQ